MAEKVTTVIAFVMVCVGFLVALAFIVLIVDAMGASASRSLAAERRKRWEARAMARGVVIARRMPRRTTDPARRGRTTATAAAPHN